MHDLLSDSPVACAKRMAAYISDPSTIHAYLRNEFGRSIGMERIGEMIADARAARSKPHNTYQTAKYDGNFRVREAIPRVAPAPPPRPRSDLTTPRGIITAIAGRFGLTYGDMIGYDRRVKVRRVRYLAIAVLVDRQAGLEHASGIYCAVGRQMGGRDHSTIINAMKRWAVMADADLRVVYAELTAKCGGPQPRPEGG